MIMPTTALDTDEQDDRHDQERRLLACEKI